MNTLLENIRASAILMKNLPSTQWGDALLISREEARRIGYELEACAERIEALERDYKAGWDRCQSAMLAATKEKQS